MRQTVKHYASLIKSTSLQKAEHACIQALQVIFNPI